VVRGPDLIFGGDIRTFRPPAGKFEGVIGGTPCQDFSRMRRTDPTGNGVAMLREYLRTVAEARPAWFLMENVRGVPDVELPPYRVQKFNLNAAEVGGIQRRLRVFFFGSLDGRPLVIDRTRPRGSLEPTLLAGEGNRTSRRGWAEFCAMQGFPEPLELPGWSIAAKYRAVGNGVPLYMAFAIARAIRDRRRIHRLARLCACGCGRILRGRQRMATVACRKRLQRRRDRYALAPRSSVTLSA